MPEDKEKQDMASAADPKIADLEKQRDEYLAGWQRAKADFINYKKDELRRLEEVAKYGAEDMMLEMVAILDSFDLAIAALEKQGAVEKGVYMIRTQMEDALKKRGLEKINISPGDRFDPAFMESVAEADTPEGGPPPGTVADEIEAGYRMHDKVLRPARVRISKQK